VKLPAPSLLLRAGLRYQMRHRWQALLALIGIVMGVAVVLAVDLANSAAKASFALSAEQLRGSSTHRLVGAAGGIPQAFYRTLFTTPGHPPIAPVVSERVRVEGRDGAVRLIGVDIFAEGAFRTDLPEVIRGTASLGDWLTRPDAVAMSASAADFLGVRLGESLNIRHAGRPYRLEVVAIHPDQGIGSRDILLVDIATAQAISGMRDRISHIDLILDAQAEQWLKGRIPPGVRLAEVGEQAAGVAGMSTAFELNLTAMSLLALLVGMFLIFNAVSFSIVQRRSLLGRLRALGVRADEILYLVLGEVLALGIVGTLLGVLLGIWLGQGLTHIVAATVSELYYQVTADAVRPGWATLGKACLLGLAGTLAAAWLPAHQAARTPPLTTLSRASLEQAARGQVRRLAPLGAALLGVGLFTAFALPGGVIAGFAGLFVMLLGAALLTPWFLQLSQALFSRLPGGGIWPMAIRDLDRHLSRLATAAAALMVALAASVGVAVMVDSMRGSVSDWLQQLLSADLYIAAEGFDDGATLPAAVVEQVVRLPHVSAISLYRNTELSLGGTPTRLVAAQLAAASLAGFELLGSKGPDPWSEFDRGGVLISEPLSNRLRLQAGDELILPTPTGSLGFPIAAVFRDYASEHGRIFMPLADYRRLWSDPLISTVALFSAQGELRRLHDAALAQLPGADALVFTAAREVYAASMAVFDRTFRITDVLRYLSLLVAVIGVFSALMAVQLERRKEYAVLRALGLTRGQIARLVTLESALLGLLAALLAIPTGLAMAWVLTDAVQLRAFGWSMPFRVAVGPLLLTLLIGVAAAMLASLYPAWRAGWHDPAPQLRED